MEFSVSVSESVPRTWRQEIDTTYDRQEVTHEVQQVRERERERQWSRYSASAPLSFLLLTSLFSSPLFPSLLSLLFSQSPRNATEIQRHFRGLRVRLMHHFAVALKEWKSIQNNGAVKIQSLCRGGMVRRRFVRLLVESRRKERIESACLRIQKNFRYNIILIKISWYENVTIKIYHFIHSK